MKIMNIEVNLCDMMPGMKMMYVTIFGSSLLAFLIKWESLLPPNTGIEFFRTWLAIFVIMCIAVIGLNITMKFLVVLWFDGFDEQEVNEV